MLDLFLIIVLAWALYAGWRNGALRELASSLGFLLGLFIAAVAYDELGSYLAIEGSQVNVVTSVIAFLLLWIVVPIALGAVAMVLTKALKELYLGWLNSTLGAFISFVKYVFLLACILYALAGLGILNEERTRSSYLYAPIEANFSAFWREALRDQDADDDDRDAPYDHDGNDEESDTTWIDVDRLR